MTPRTTGTARTPRTGPGRAALAGRLSIGVDIGGTKVAAGVVDENGLILARARKATPSQSPRAVEDTIVGVVAELREHHHVASVGIGAAGLGRH